MNLQEYLQLAGKVILATDVIHAHINFDRRTNYGKRNKQTEFEYFDKNPNVVEKVSHSTTSTISDFKKLNSAVIALDKIYKPITSALIAQFPDCYFELMINNEDVSIIENYLHIIGCNRNGTPFTDEDIKNTYAFLIIIFNEIDNLIIEINKTIPVKDISSIILVSSEPTEDDQFKYKNKGASEFVHALFNSDLEKTTLATTININNVKTELPDPERQSQKVLLDKPHVIYGTLEIESQTSSKFRAKGFYLDEDKITNIPFNEIVYCKAAGDLKDEYAELFNYINNELCGTKIKVIIKSLQPYVCHEDIEAKNKYIDSVVIIELT